MDRILILDFGSQVTQLIARRVREHGVFCEIHPYHMPLSAIQTFAPKGIILSGGPSSVHMENAPKVEAALFTLGLPILGICYGQQLMCHTLGGVVEGAEGREFGRAMLTITRNSPMLEEMWHVGQSYPVWMSHGDTVTTLPEGFEILATTEDCPHALIADEARHFYGMQFHPEVVHTPDGAALLQHFTHQVCGCSGDWTMGAFVKEQVQVLRETIGDGQVICGVSGGVDSSVVAALLHEAIGDQLHAIFVDTGLLRKDEGAQVRAMFADHHIPLVTVEAEELFLSRLAGISDPEQKRKIIGNTFIEVFEKEAKKVGGAAFLAQGTLYPDVIESVSVHGDASVTIKSHHNVGGLPDRMHLKLVEPVRELFKDEVRAVGKELGLPAAMLGRHPFPGPGLAIRIPGDITAEKVRILQEVDAIYIQSIRDAGLYDLIWQAFAVLLPVRSVGVMGDARTYDYVCALRAVTSTDGMTADFYPFEMAFLSEVSNRIINRVRGINRVTYDITSKPPGTIEWE